MSRSYVESLSVNEHATTNLGTRCSCPMCRNHDSRRTRTAEKRRWRADTLER